jgi:shikimate kinase
LRTAVICLGGGTVRYEWNIDVLRGTGLIILLEAPLDELVERVRAADRKSVEKEVEELKEIVLEHSEKFT